MSSRNEIIERILQFETAMFKSVPSEGKEPCAEDIENFRRFRKSQFLCWSTETLKSYNEDLMGARLEGRNFFTLKYARMADKIPPLSENKDIKIIAEQFRKWQEEVYRQFPEVEKNGRPAEEFEKYIASELETYSDNTIALLKKDVEKYSAENKNMSLEIYRNLK